MRTSIGKVAYEANEILHQFREETLYIKQLMRSSPRSINWWARFLGMDPSGLHYKLNKNRWTPSEVIHFYNRLKLFKNFEVVDSEFFLPEKYTAPVDPKRELEYY